jgi:hypothetical protein
VAAVLDECARHLPPTLRQVFHRLVTMALIDKTEPAYDQLGETAGAVALIQGFMASTLAAGAFRYSSEDRCQRRSRIWYRCGFRTIVITDFGIMIRRFGIVIRGHYGIVITDFGNVITT